MIELSDMLILVDLAATLAVGSSIIILMIYVFSTLKKLEKIEILQQRARDKLNAFRYEFGAQANRDSRSFRLIEDAITRQSENIAKICDKKEPSSD